MPKNKLKDRSIFDRINIHIKNFSWSKCLAYPTQDDRRRYCNILFQSNAEIQNCQNNYCDSCCNRMVDGTNKEHNFLCAKQCQTSLMGEKKSDWRSCTEPSSPETSVYPYCDEQFPKDFFSRQRCKTDMCNLCCVSMDQKEAPIYSDEAVNTCYSKCAKSKL